MCLSSSETLSSRQCHGQCELLYWVPQRPGMCDCEMSPDSLQLGRVWLPLVSALGFTNSHHSAELQ